MPSRIQVYTYKPTTIYVQKDRSRDYFVNSQHTIRDTIETLHNQTNFFLFNLF